MALIRCSNGHMFSERRYGTVCPYCHVETTGGRTITNDINQNQGYEKQEIEKDLLYQEIDFAGVKDFWCQDVNFKEVKDFWLQDVDFSNIKKFWTQDITFKK